jgi:hypothetical protein
MGCIGIEPAEAKAELELKGQRVEASFDCVWRKLPRQTPLRMTDFATTTDH